MKSVARSSLVTGHLSLTEGKKEESDGKVSMDYLGDIPLINPYLSVISKAPKEVVLNVCGKIKRLKCNSMIFEDALSFIDGQKTLGQILGSLKEKYPEDFLDHFFKILTQSEIIGFNSSGVQGEEEPRSIHFEGDGNLIEKMKAHPPGIIGNGLLADTVAERFKESCGTNSYRILNSNRDSPDKTLLFQNEALATNHHTALDINFRNNPKVKELTNILKQTSVSFLIACLERTTNEWLLALNEACLELNLPWIPCYFNGKHVLLGPTVVPWKSPCYGCLVEHKLSQIYTNSGLRLTFEDIFEIIESWPIPDTFDGREAAIWVGSLLFAEALRLIDGATYPEYVKRQLRIPLHATHSFTELKFETITTCPACYGLNRDKLVIGHPENIAIPDHARISLKEVPVQHDDNGYRALSAKDARKMIDQALTKMGASMKITKNTSGSLDKILPTYRSEISNFYKHDFPLLIHREHDWGKGITEDQAYLSAAYELFERICSGYYGHVDMIRASYEEVKDSAMDVENRIGTVHYDRNIDRFDRRLPIDWVWGYSLVKERPILVPASMVYQTKCKFLGKFHLTTTGGLAAGTTIEDAILQGLMETIEHDAWYIWQANAITTPKVRIESINDPDVAKILDEIRQIGFHLIIRYQATDIGVPVFRTWLVNEKDYAVYASSGFGANLDPCIALKRSITEAKLAWPSIPPGENLYYSAKNSTSILETNVSLYSLYHFNKTDVLKEGKVIDFDEIPNLSTGTIARDIKKSVKLIKRAVPKADIIVVNLEKEIFKIPVVRVVSAGLQNASIPLQNFPEDRVFKVPKIMGYRDHELSFVEIFNDRHPY